METNSCLDKWKNTPTYPTDSSVAQLIVVKRHARATTLIVSRLLSRLRLPRMAVPLLHPLLLRHGPPLRHPGVRERQGQRLAVHAGPHPPHHHRDELPGRPAGCGLRGAAPLLHMLLQRALVTLLHDAGELQLRVVRRD